MYILHIRILRVLSGLLILSLIRNLILKLHYNSMSVITKYQTTGKLFNRPCNPVNFASKRTMSTSSKSAPVIIYTNPDKEKELIVNENKGRTGIYLIPFFFLITESTILRQAVKSVIRRFPQKSGIRVHLKSGKSYIGSSRFFSITRPYSTLNNKYTNTQPNKSLIPAAIYPEAYINKTIILKDNKTKREFILPQTFF